MSKWGYDQQEYLLTEQHTCGKKPRILFRQDLAQDGKAGAPYLWSFKRCCPGLRGFMFFGRPLVVYSDGVVGVAPESKITM